jgi:hypothetical protein
VLVIALSRLSFLPLRNGQIPSQPYNQDPDQLSLFGLLIAPMALHSRRKIRILYLRAAYARMLDIGSTLTPAREVIYETVAHPLLRRGIACFAHGSAVVGAENGIVGVAST